VALVADSFQADIDHPVVGLVIVNKVRLPVVRQAVPEEAEHVRDYQREQCHLEDVHHGQDRPIIRNLVISMLVVSVAPLHPVEQCVFWDEIARSQP